MRLLHLVPILLSAGTQALAADVSFGELPAGAISTNVMQDVYAEMCRDHLFDPSLIETRLPENDRLILAAEPMAQFADLQVTQAEPDLWRMRLALPNESIEAEVRGSGQRMKRNAPEPGFMSVPFAGKSAGSFWVITYFGHHHQSAQGQWHAKGSGVFSDALQIPGEASVFKTFFQDGWSALSGLYRP